MDDVTMRTTTGTTMKRITRWITAGCLCVLAGAMGCSTDMNLTAEQIVAKHVEARGGAQAWRKIQTMVWTGHVDSPNSPTQGMPFSLKLQRPDKTRFEIAAMNQVVVHVFDGKEGWKMRPSNGGELDVRDYTAQENKFARDEQVIDGLLIDHDRKGIVIDLEGRDQVGGRDAWRLSLRLPSGSVQHVWIDTRSYLDVKYTREGRGIGGQPTMTEIVYRDFREVDGVRLPFIIESGPPGGDRRDRLVIDTIALNAPLDALAFARPVSTGAHHSIDVGGAMAPMNAASVMPPPPVIRQPVR